MSCLPTHKGKRYNSINELIKAEGLEDKFKQLSDTQEVSDTEGTPVARFVSTKKNAYTLLSENAPEGSLYHEIFHNVSMLFTTKEERQALYNEARQVLKGTTVEVQSGNKIIQKKAEDMTDKEAEEYLAEEFRIFVLIGRDNYKFGQQTVKRNIFQRMWDALVDMLLGNNAHMDQIYRKDPAMLISKFEQIMSSEYRMADRVERSEVSLDRIGRFTSSQSHRMVNAFNNDFFRTAELLGVPYSSILLNQEYIYEVLRANYLVKSENNPIHAVVAADEVWSNLVGEHSRYVRKYSLGVVQDLSDLEERNSKDNTQMVETNLTNHKTNMSSTVRLMLLGLPKAVINEKTGKINSVSSNLGTGFNQSADFSKTAAILHKNLANVTSFDKMVTIIRNFADNGYPHFHHLLHILGVRGADITPHNLSEDVFYLQNSFFDQMYKTENSYVTNIVSDDNMYSVSSKDTSSQNRVIDIWKTRAKTSDKKFTKLFVSQKGQIFIDSQGSQPMDGFDLSFQESSPLQFSRMPKQGRLKLMKDILRDFGMDLHYSIDDIDAISNTVAYLFREIKRLSRSRRYIAIDEIFNRRIFILSSDIKKLADLQIKATDEFIDNQHINSRGQTEYALMLKNGVISIVDSLNEGVVPEFLQPYDFAKRIGNLYTLESAWIEYMTANPGKVKAVILRDYGREQDEKAEINDLTRPDLIMNHFFSVMSGNFPFLRAAERKMEYSFDFGTNYVDEVVPTEVFRNRLLKYLKNEIIISLAKRSNKESKKLYRLNGLSDSVGLTFFEKITPSIHKELLTDGYSEISPTDFEKVADQLVKDFKAGKAVDKYIIERRKSVTRFLEQNAVVKITPREEKNAEGDIVTEIDYTINNFAERQKKLIGHSRELNRVDFESIVDTFNYHYTVSNIEQTKLFTGDIRTYMKEDGRSDLFKRTTTFVSTRKSTRNDAAAVSFMNEKAPRLSSVFGYEHTDIFRDFVYQDTVVESEYIGLIRTIIGSELAKSYENISSNDARGLATLDGYKRLNISSWTDAHEQSWQYQAQMLARIMYERNLITLEDYKRLFRQHIPESFNESSIKNNESYFKGEKIGSVANLLSLTPSKPQSTGILMNSDIREFNARQVTKTAVMPLLTSDLVNYPDLLDFAIDATMLGMDFIFPESAKKGEILSNKRGELASFYKEDGSINKISELVNQPEEDSQFSVEEISWGDISIQMDIDPAGHRRVTYSSQKRKLEFVDMFRNAVPSDNFKAESEQVEKNKIEHDKLISELVIRGMNKVIADLGIEQTQVVDDIYTYNLVDSSAFVNTLINEFEKRDFPDNLFEAIDIIMRSSLVVFDTMPNRRQVMNVLSSMIRNNAISIKVNGDMYVQDSTVGYDAIKRSNVKSSGRLKYYRLADSNGNEVTSLSKATQILPAQAMMNLPRNWISFVEQNFSGQTFEQKLQEFNKAIKNKNWEHYEAFKKLRIIAANRTPAQHRNSMEVLEIVEFLSPLGGNKLIIPDELVAKSGSDFDIDKLNTYLNSFYFDSKGVPTYSKYLTSENSNLEDRVNAVYRSNSDISRILAKVVDVADFNETISYIESVKDGLSRAYQSRKDIFRNDEEINNFDFNIDFLYKRIQRAKSKKKKDSKRINNLYAQMFYFIEQKKEYMEGFMYADKIFKELNERKEAVLNMLSKVMEGMSIEEQNTSKAVENRLNELSMETTLNVGNFESLIKPNNSDIVKQQADVIKPVTEKISPDGLLSFEHIIQTSVDYWNSLTLVGVTAVNTVHHAMTQLNPIKANTALVKVLLRSENDTRPSEEILSSELYLGHVMDSEGNLISDNNTAIVTAAVDAQKEESPSITRINLTPDTANAYFILNRLGSDKANPIGFKFLTKFFTHDVILEYSRLVDISRAKFIDERISRREIIKNLVGKYASDSPMLHELFVQYTQAAPSKRSSALFDLETRFEQLLRKFPGLLTENNLYDSDKRGLVLELYLYYIELGRTLRDLQSITRNDSIHYPTRPAYQIRKVRAERFLDLGIFDIEDIQEFWANSFDGTFKFAHDEGQKMFDNFWLTTRNEELREFMWGDTGIVNLLLDGERTLSEDKLGAAMTKIEAAVLSGILHLTPIDGTRLNSMYKNLLMGKNSLPKKLARIQQKYKGQLDNRALDEIIPIINEFASVKNKNIDNDYLKLYNRRLTPQESNALTEGIRELGENSNEEISEVGERLTEFALIQSGLLRSPVSFFEVLPAEYYHTLVNALFRIFNEGSSSPVHLGESFEAEVIANIANDTDIVPRKSKGLMINGRFISKMHKNDTQYHVIDGSAESRSKYIYVETQGVNKETANMMRESGIKVPMVPHLFKRTNKTIKNTKYTFRVYERIPLRGDRMRFMEFQGNIAKDSIIPENNSGYEISPRVMETPIEESDKKKHVFKLMQAIGYSARTKYVAENSDASIVFDIVKQDSAGTRSLKRALANESLLETISLPTQISGFLKVQKPMVDKIVKHINTHKASTINIAGNGLSTLVKFSKGYTQEKLDGFMYSLLKQVTEHKDYKTGSIKKVITGGQTGIDEAASKAAVKLGISSEIIVPKIDIKGEIKDWVFRDASNKDVGDKSKFIERFNLAPKEKKDYTKPDKKSDTKTKPIINQKGNNKNLFEQMSASYDIKPDAKLNKALEGFFDSVGYTVKPVSQLITRAGEIIGNEEMGSIALTDIVNKTISVVEGRSDISTLAEEAAHIYVEMLSDSDVLLKQMMYSITNYEIYREVFDQYKNNPRYMTDGNPNITKIKKEAIGKLIAREIINEHEQRTKQTSNWLRALWNRIKSWFSIDNAFKQTAIDILNANIERLREEQYGQTDTVFTEYEQSDNLDKMGMMYEDNERSRKEAEERERKLQEYRDRLERDKRDDYEAEQAAEQNAIELSKVSEEVFSDLQAIRKEIYDNFDKYFPQFAEEYTAEQKFEFVKSMSEGQIDVVC